MEKMELGEVAIIDLNFGGSRVSCQASHSEMSRYGFLFFIILGGREIYWHLTSLRSAVYSEGGLHVVTKRYYYIGCDFGAEFDCRVYNVMASIGLKLTSFYNNFPVKRVVKNNLTMKWFSNIPYTLLSVVLVFKGWSTCNKRYVTI